MLLPTLVTMASTYQKTQNHINKINAWTEQNMIKLNESKSQYMIVNFTEDWKFCTQLSIENHLLEQVSEAKLLGVWIIEDLKWEKKHHRACQKLICKNDHPKEAQQICCVH